MAYRSTYDLVLDLEKNGMLRRVKAPVEANLEMAEIHRRVNANGGPAIFFENIKGSKFPAVSNLFGTRERAFFIFRKTLKRVKHIVAAKADPSVLIKHPLRTLSTLPLLVSALPRRSWSLGRLQEVSMEEIPMIKSWPMDGGAFVTLPQVYSEDIGSQSVFHSNLGMYRVQLSGNRYEMNKTIGLHYQIHRGIGVHHHAAIMQNKNLPVSVFAGGPPAMSFAAVMPLPEGLSEVLFSGLMGGRGFRFYRAGANVVATDADFVFTGEIRGTETLPEGPFGDHLGYYSLQHDFPVMHIQKVYALKKNAVWPFTVVGRPPQEDSIFGEIIHEVTGPMVPASLPGVKSVHAVDTSGVHPLLLAIGSERYVPYGKRKPLELMTIAHSILGFNQMSLAKYLFLMAHEDAPGLDIHDIPRFFMHIFERIDFSRDLHFVTRTTMDTLDYSGNGINLGSKLVVTAAGPVVRKLASQWPEVRMPKGFGEVQIVLPGIFAVKAPKFRDYAQAVKEIHPLEKSLSQISKIKNKPVPALVVIVDDSEFTAKNLANFIWVTFTRSNPSHDIYGAASRMEHKHWMCEPPMIIDARIKSHHAPLLIEDKKTTKLADRHFQAGGDLHGLG